VKAPPPTRFLAISGAAAIVAAAAAYASTVATIPVWAMFMGWVAFYTRGHSTRAGVANLACLALGIALGLTASLAVGALHPQMGGAALPLVVLLVALLVISLRAVPVLDNVLAYFLGLISVFAAHASPGLEAFAQLTAAAALGGIAAGFARAWQGRIGTHANS
jgi:Protein of unknown function (DUF1097)